MLRFLLTCCLITGVFVPADAAMLVSGNVLVSEFFGKTVTEYTHAGGFVQSFSIPDSDEGATSQLRDIIVDENGQIQIYNGTFEAELASLDPLTSGISTQTLSELSTVNNLSFGGIAVLGDSVFLTDMETAGAEAQGIVRFSTTGDPPVRFATAEDYRELTLGLDGNLYAVRHGGSDIDVFDPVTNAFIRTIDPEFALANADIRGLSVDANGLLYIAAWDGSIYMADSDGNILSSLVTGFSNLTDIDIHNSGELVAGSRFGNVVFTDTSLSPITSFTVDSGNSIFVSFTDPLNVQAANVPEPTSLALLGLSASGFGVAARRRRKLFQQSDPLRNVSE